MKEKNYITPQGHAKLLEEHERLTKVERPEVVKVVQWAASLGDRSENADYLYGKRKLRQIDSRLRFLNKRIDAAVIVDPLKIKTEKVQFGARVKVSDGDGNKKTYTIVGVDEVAINSFYISWKSPIGSALMGKERGDSVIVKAPKGEVELEILEISYDVIEYKADKLIHENEIEEDEDNEDTF